MEFLGVEDYDESRQRCLCPRHEEDTPSFIYNPKTYECHCFGCGTNADFIDAYMKGRNATFIEATEKLFETAGIQHSFGEHKVQTRRQYRYPNPVECEDKSRAYKYLKTRKISQETADYLDIRQDDGGNLVFNYYDLNDVLTMVKYRPSRKVKKGENKVWCQQGADTTPLLFNMNRINTTQPLVICCGELDCAALIESGIQNAVSIPLGDGNTHWIEECWDFLEQFSEIVLTPDNDQAGNKFVKEVVPRLGSWRCKIANCPAFYESDDGKQTSIKDINEVLFYYGKEKVVEIIANAADSPIPSVVDFVDVEEKDLSVIDGVEIGIREMDKHFMRLFFGSFNVLSGTPGAGKTSWLYQLVCNALDQGVGCWVFSRELPGFMTKNWVNYLLAGPRNVNEYTNDKGAPYYKVTAEAKRGINTAYRGQFYLYRDDYSNAVEDIQASMTDSARKYGSKLFLVDNLMTVDLHATDSDKYDKQTAFVNWLIQFSAKYDVCTILVVHPHKLQFGQTDMEMYDIGGSANIVNLAHRGFGLKRIKDKEKEGTRNKSGDGWLIPPYPYDVKMTTLKDRFTGHAGYEMGIYYDRKSRRFFTNPEEYDHQYRWDTNTYADTLPYPITDNEEEVLGRHIEGK